MFRHHSDDRARTAGGKGRENRDIGEVGVVITPFEAEMIGFIAEMPGAFMKVAREPAPYSSR
jgi:hypothetical protein